MKFTEWTLRISISAGYLSAVADRFGIWNVKLCVWGNWEAFVAYTQTLLPFLPIQAVNIAAILATVAEVALACMLLIPFKTRTVALLSALLLCTFGICMAIWGSVKQPLDYSVFTAAAASLGLMQIAGKK